VRIQRACSTSVTCMYACPTSVLLPSAAMGILHARCTLPARSHALCRRRTWSICLGRSVAFDASARRF
jgi:hypothetical protein